MDPIEILSNEHWLIRRFVDLLSTAVARLEVEAPPERAFFDTSIDFVRGFSDGFHHKKEELVMFVQLAQKKNGAIDGQIEALRYQHDQGRGFIAAIDNALDDYERGDPKAHSIVRENAAAFASLLKHHIHIEDHIFFPMSREAMTPEELDELGEKFAKVQEVHGADTFQRYHKTVVDLGDMLAENNALG
jgi:hemerythrin-like domain-containing protein